MGILIPDQLLESETLTNAKVMLRLPLAALDEFITTDKDTIPEQIKDWATMPLS